MEAKSILVGGCGNLGKLKEDELELACGEALKSNWWTVAIDESVINANGRIGAMVDLVAAIVINIDKTTTELLEWLVPIEQVTQTIIDEAWSSPVGLLRRDVIGEDVYDSLSSAPTNDLRLTMRREVLRILTLLYGLWLVPGPAVAAVGAVASAMSNPKPKAEAEGRSRRPKPQAEAAGRSRRPKPEDEEDHRSRSQTVKRQASSVKRQASRWHQASIGEAGRRPK
jgi:hypothetical protein